MRCYINAALLLLIAMAPLAMNGGTASAALLHETFEGESSLPTGWSEDGGGQTYSVADDSGGLGSGDALFVDATGISVNRTFASFPSVTLANENDAIRVTYDFRYEGTPSVENGNTPSFGLYDGTADGSNGYVANYGTNDASGTFGIGREDSEFGVLGGNDIISLGFGSGTFPDAVGLDEGVNYTFEMTLIRTAAGLEVNSVVTGDDSTTFTYNGVDDTTPHYTFNTFGIRTRRSQFAIDNVVIEKIPEPASLALIGLAGAIVLSRWRRNVR